MLSVACVSASDNQTDVISEEEPHSFDDLKNDINATGDTFDVQYNYKYGGENISNIPIVKNKFVINGNDHVIDASNKTEIFLFSPEAGSANETDIVINNLTFINSKGAITAKSCRITLNNVNFYGHSVFAVSGSNSQITVNNCTFKSKNVTAEIATDSFSDVVINESTFCDGFAKGSIISINRGTLVVENCVFENLTSKYAGAINYKGDYLSVRKSKFSNVSTNLTAGAIIIKFFPRYNETTHEYIRYGDMLIEDCTFDKVLSLKNGGAIMSDLGSRLDNKSKTLHIINTNFTNCESGFGGAILIVGGILNISNSTFVNNTADFNGGAIYTSWCNLTIADSKFYENMAFSDAGAIYFDMGKLIIRNSILEKNLSPGYANAIYANDVCAEIINSTFKNGGVGVYAVFASNSKLENNTSTDLFLMNNTNYVVSVENNGIRLNLTGNEIVVDKLPSKFDARDWGWVTPLKDQADACSCWAFATTGAIEVALLKSTGVAYDLSEDNLQSIQFRYFSQGDTRNPEIGFAYSGLGYALSWYGVIQQEDDPYDERDVVSDVMPTKNRIHVQDAMIIFGGRNDTEQLLKQALIKYGALSIQFEPDAFGAISGNFYVNQTDVQPDHFVTLIGYDDNYPIEKFINPPSKPGAWIIKNSWGPVGGNQGYGYISYEDTSFLAVDKHPIIPQNAAVAYIFENTIDYHVNYQTDLTGLTGFDGNYTYYSNEFTSQYDELIGAVGTYFNESGISYSFDIYVNGAKVHSQSGISEFAGFRTIILSKYIPVKQGDKFKVVFKNNNLPYQAYSRSHYIQGMSFVSVDGKSWSDITLKNKTVCLKVYTVKDDTKIIDNKDITVDYDGGSYFSVKVITADGRAVGQGAVVKFTINGKTYTVKTDDNGIAKVKITDVPKKYTMTITYNGKTYKNTVTVKQVLTASKVTIKKSAKKLVLKAKLKINGKLVKGKKITFKFRGKKYTVKTNKNGIAKKTLNKKVIKKLKKGKKYTVKVTYLKDTIKTTVKVKR